jgi:hypothetical protein
MKKVKKEIVVNLWYVVAKEGMPTPIILLLMGKAYGLDKNMSEANKLDFLQKQSLEDYKEAARLPVDTNYCDRNVNVVDLAGKDYSVPNTLPLAWFSLTPMNRKLLLFEPIFVKLEQDANITIPEQPLVCITPINIDKNGALTISIDNVVEIK